MGESKRRKETDPNYGKISTKIRGIILSPPVDISGTSIHIRLADLDGQDLRSTLLYWDRIALPTSNILHIPGGQDVDYLAHSGILQRLHYSFIGDGAQSLITAQNQAMIDLEKQYPGAWSLGSGENSLLINQGLAQPEHGSLLTLYNALPVPKENTPLAEILEFKHKRRDELLALRAHIESLSEEISNSKDSTEELNRITNELDIACSELIKTSKEYQLPVYLANMNASLNFEATKAIGTAIGVWTSTTKLGLGVTAATVASFVSAAATTISLKADMRFQSVKRLDSPYKYAYLVQRDLN